MDRVRVGSVEGESYGESESGECGGRELWRE